MSVFQGKLTAAEQQKTWPTDKRSRGGGWFDCILLGTRVQVYSKVCLWLRGQEIHLGGNWNVGRLKGHDRYVSLGGGNQMTFTCSLMSVRMRRAPWQSSWKAEMCTWRLTYTKWQISENGPSLTVYADSNPLTRVSMNAARRERERRRMRRRGERRGGGGWWGRGFYWI